MLTMRYSRESDVRVYQEDILEEIQELESQLQELLEDGYADEDEINYLETTIEGKREQLGELESNVDEYVTFGLIHEG